MIHRIVRSRAPDGLQQVLDFQINWYRTCNQMSYHTKKEEEKKILIITTGKGLPRTQVVDRTPTFLFFCL